MVKERGAVVFGIVACLCLWRLPAHAAEETLKKASFLPQWYPQAQFAGYYVAKEKGFYRQHGIDLTILPGGAEYDPSVYLSEGRADFVTMWLATGIEKRAAGVPLVNIAQIVQRSALMLIAKRSHGIRTPQDMNGKTVGLWENVFQTQPRAFFKKYGLTVRVIPQSHSVNLFLRDGVDVASAMRYNEFHTLINSGLEPDELTLFLFHEHGLNVPEDGIYTLEATFDRDPELCRGLVRASLEGWQYAFAHPDEAVDIVLTYMKAAHIPANRMHQRWMLQEMKALIVPAGGTVPFGVLTEEAYDKAAAVLREGGFVSEAPAYDSFYRKCDGDDAR